MSIFARFIEETLVLTRPDVCVVQIFDPALPFISLEREIRVYKNSAIGPDREMFQVVMKWFFSSCGYLLEPP